VTQGEKTLFASDFTKGSEGWKAVHGDWKVQDGAFRQSGGGDNLFAIAGDPSWSEYTYTLKARKLGGAEGFLIMFQVKDEKNWVWWNIGGWSNSKHAVERSKDGSKTTLGREAGGNVETGRWYDIKVELKGGKATCSLGGKKIHSVDLGQAHGPRFYALGGKDEKTGQIIIKVVNGSATPTATTFKVSGAAGIGAKARVFTLAGEKPTGKMPVPPPTDENTLEEPTKVVPVESSFDGAGPEFRYTVKPYSLTILRLKAGK